MALPAVTYEAVLRILYDEFDGRIFPKDGSRLMRAIDVFLRVVSFGKMTAFLTHFVSTLGYTVYVPSSWDTMTEPAKAIVLRHEMVHMRQYRRLGFWFKFLYLLGGLPIGAAYWRAKFEQEAYAESVLATAQIYGIDFVHQPEYREAIIKHFTSAEYLWMWPFRKQLDAWFDSVLRDVRARWGLSN